MELGMRLRCCQLPPNTNSPPRTAISFGAWPPRSSHLAVLRGRPCRSPRRAWAPRIAAPDSRPLETTSANSIGQGTKLRGDKFFTVEMAVREFVTASLTTREEIASRLGIGRCSIASTGRAMALSELNLHYFAPLKRGAKFVVMVRIVGIKGVRMLMEHLIDTLLERKLVLEAMATVVCLNKDYRPTRMFPEMANLLHFFSLPN
ncbi:hypothetical protein BAE44_0021242 [Dichanthelium oligosanthes]|uniref:Thioesterase domain-containing protein n=1 Tax=Dichanthelium oligosanthes TaxID=888268 RepID=A0A1E5UY65_9POAL|nr:hypothetical protein BAE44_0021242 [Dichanthelium oligosanthes]